MQFPIIVLASVLLTTLAEASIFFRASMVILQEDHLVNFFDPITNETLLEPMVGPLLIRSAGVNPPIERVATTDTFLSSRATTTAKPATGGGWFSNIRRPCSCAGVQCGCCAGVDFKRINFRRQYCTNFTYDPQEFAVMMDVLMNDDSIYQNQVSAKNPDPICVPVPYLPIGADLCVKMFNIFTPGRNLHMCMDWQARVQKAPVLVLHFDCMRFGQDGVALVKPDQNGGLEAFGGNGGAAGGVDSVVVESVDSNGSDGSDQTGEDIFDGVSETIRTRNLRFT